MKVVKWEYIFLFIRGTFNTLSNILFITQDTLLLEENRTLGQFPGVLKKITWRQLTAGKILGHSLWRWRADLTLKLESYEKFGRGFTVDWPTTCCGNWESMSRLYKHCDVSFKTVNIIKSETKRNPPSCICVTTKSLLLPIRTFYRDMLFSH